MNALDLFVLQLIESMSRRRDRILSNAEAQIIALWQRTDPYDGASVQRFVREAARISGVTQDAAVTLTAATQRQIFERLGFDVDVSPKVDHSVRAWGEPESDWDSPVAVKTRSGEEQRVPAERVFERVAREFRYERSKGGDQQKALADSLERAKMILDGNVQLAERDARVEIYQDVQKRNKGVQVGYRRIIHPELSKTGTCGLCYIAADRVYKDINTWSLHNNCHCTVLPIIEHANGSVDDPGQKLSRDDLDKVYAEAGSTYANDLITTIWKPDEHGEMRLVMKKGESISNFKNSKGARPDWNEILRAEGDEWVSEWFPSRDDLSNGISALRRDIDELTQFEYADDSRAITWRKELAGKLEQATAPQKEVETAMV